MYQIDTQILRALNESRFRARTIGGIANELGISKGVVAQIDAA